MTAPAIAGMPLVIAGVGAFTPLGPTWQQTCASIRAGLNRFADHPYFEALTPDPEWDEADPLRCSVIPEWDESLDEPRRLFDLTMAAFRDLTDRLALRRDRLARGGLLLALPADADCPGARDPERGVVAQLIERSGLDELAHAEPCGQGQAGVFTAMKEAITRIRGGDLDYCFVGGADTHFIDARLEALDRAWRLKTGRNDDGYLPGEAAGILLITSPRFAPQLGATPLCLLGEVGVGREPQTVGGERASTGQGLADALTQALGGERPAARVFCDLNGESYRSFEWGLLQARMADQLGGLKQLAHPADCLGDVGAATGALLAACAVHAFARLPGPVAPALLWASSDDGARGAMLAHPLQGEGG